MANPSDPTAPADPVADLAPLSWPVPVRAAVPRSFDAVQLGILLLGMVVLVCIGTVFEGGRYAGGFVFVGFVVLVIHAVAANDRRERQALGQIAEHVRRTVAARPDTSAAWGTDPERRRVAAAARQAFAEVIGWPNDHFLPDDPLELLYVQDMPDDFDAVNVNGYLVRATGRRVDWRRTPLPRTLADLVDAYLPPRPTPDGPASVVTPSSPAAPPAGRG